MRGRWRRRLETNTGHSLLRIAVMISRRARRHGSTSISLPKAVFSIEELTAPFIDGLADEILARRPKIVGCSSVFEQHVASIALLRRIKEHAPGVVTMITPLVSHLLDHGVGYQPEKLPFALSRGGEVGPPGNRDARRRAARLDGKGQLRRRECRGIEVRAGARDVHALDHADGHPRGGTREPELLDLGIIRDLGPSYSTAELSLRVILGNWYFTQAPTADPRAYFGDDSLGLLWRLRPPREARCLDLCSGPGIQAIHAARLGGEVTAVEINPIAASLATINVSINELEDRVQVLAGDLYEPVGGRVFDHVFANPPLLPFPNDVHYPFVGHGGNDGMRVTKRIMDGLPAALSPHGSAQIIGTALSDGTMLSVEVELSRWCREHGMDLLITIVSSQDISPGSRLFESLVATSIASMESDVEMVRAELGRLTEELGTLCGVFLRFSHGEGNLDVQDISSANGGHFWFV
jgi:release factor glutamine methyltransferase